MNLLLQAAKSDALTLVKAGQLLGDPALPGGHAGTHGARLEAASRDGALESTGGAFVSREALGRYLVAHGSESDRRSLAFRWAQGIGRIAPPAPPKPAVPKRTQPMGVPFSADAKPRYAGRRFADGTFEYVGPAIELSLNGMTFFTERGAS